MCYDTCLGRNVQGTHRRTLSLACPFASPGVVSKPRFLAAHRLIRRALSCQAQRELPAPPSHTIVDTVDGRTRVAPAVHVTTPGQKCRSGFIAGFSNFAACCGWHGWQPNSDA